MKTARLLALLVIAPSLATACFGASGDVVTSAWNQKAAAQYLDSREIWWQSWDAAKRDRLIVSLLKSQLPTRPNARRVRAVAMGRSHRRDVP